MGLANNVDREMLSSLHFNDEFNNKKRIEIYLFAG